MSTLLCYVCIVISRPTLGISGREPPSMKDDNYRVRVPLHAEVRRGFGQIKPGGAFREARCRALPPSLLAQITQALNSFFTSALDAKSEVHAKLPCSRISPPARNRTVMAARASAPPVLMRLAPASAS